MNDEINRLLESGKELTDDAKMKVSMYFLGTISAMHEHLDKLRNGFDSQDAIDHNVEQAQISLEVAGMRIHQAQMVWINQMEEAEAAAKAKAPEAEGS